MNNTTKMYIEHIVIGMQTLLVFLFMFIKIDSAIIQYFIKLSSVLELVLVIPVAYAIGILVDRLCKYMLFTTKREDEIKKEMCMKVFEGCKNKNSKENKCKDCENNRISIDVWKEFNELDYYNDAMTRKRVLRATAFNSALAILVIIVLLHTKFLELTITTGSLLVLLLAVTLSCIYVYNKFLYEYYEKQKKYVKESVANKEKGLERAAAGDAADI